MTYRDFSNRQIAKLRRDSHKAMLAYGKLHPNETLNPALWQAAWSKAFLAGVNMLEGKYRNLSLFDETLLPKEEVK